MTLEDQFRSQKYWCDRCKVFHWPRGYWVAKTREKLAADFRQRIDAEVERRLIKGEPSE